MKCGICHSDQMDVFGTDHKTVLRQRTMRNAHDVWDHKYRAHPDEVRELFTASTNKRQAKEKLERAEDQRRKDQRTAASTPCIGVHRPGYLRPGLAQYYLTTTSELSLNAGNPNHALPSRYPEPEIIGVYHEVMQQIEVMKAESEDLLKRAWEAGLPISEADIDAVQAAGEVDP